MNQSVKYPGETSAYREARNALLDSELALREQIESVAAQRRSLPRGGQVPQYQFVGAQGTVDFVDLFGASENLIVYSFMYGPGDSAPCPMCSAFVDSLSGHIEHVLARSNVVVVARRPYSQLETLVAEKGWSGVPFYSTAECDYAKDYLSELPNGAQVPMCNVFTKSADGVHHFWGSEGFYAGVDGHPRHMDMLWPLWHFFDLLPEGRGEFMPRLEY